MSPRVALFLLVVMLGACAGSANESEIVEPAAALTTAPEPTSPPPPTAVPEPTATTTPTAVPEPTATPAPTPSPEPTVEVPPPTVRSAATIEDVANAGIAALDTELFTPTQDPSREVCSNTTSALIEYQPIGGIQSEKVGITRTNSFWAFSFATADEAQAALDLDRQGLTTCLERAGQRVRSQQDWIYFTDGGRTITNGFATAGSVMIRTLSFGPDAITDDKRALLETLRSAGEQIALAPRRPDRDPQDLLASVSQFIRPLTVLDQDGEEIATYEQAVVLPTDLGETFESTTCESQDNSFGEFAVTATDESADLFCGALLPIQAIDATTNLANESHAFFVANSCPSTFYDIVALEVPTAISQDPQADPIVLDQATVLAYQCLLRSAAE